MAKEKPLNVYRVTFVKGKQLTIKTPDKLIKAVEKFDHDGVQPFFCIEDERMINLNNIITIENVTPIPAEEK